MAKNIQFEQENNEVFEEGTVVEKVKKENPVTKKWNGLKTWQKVAIGGTVIGGLAAFVVKKVFFKNSAPATTDVVKDVVEATTEAVSEAAPF